MGNKIMNMKKIIIAVFTLLPFMISAQQINKDLAKRIKSDRGFSQVSQINPVLMPAPAIAKSGSGIIIHLSNWRLKYIQKKN